MKIFNKVSIFLVLLVFTTITACRKSEVLDTSRLPNLGGDTWVSGEIDDWIYDNLTKPYNIQVKYKFDQFEADVLRTLVPIKEEFVIPSMKAMNDVFIQPYVDVRDIEFMKTYVPKQVVLVGSPSYNTNGTIILGQAEGGKKILLLDMNTFSLKNKPRFLRMMHTMHHEFGHILNQKVPYSTDFQLISKQDYTGNWNQVSSATANSKGFVTPYAMSGDGEDFVEIVSTMLAEGKEYYESIVNAQPQEVQAIFRKKEDIVARYYRDIWGIDLYKLQAKVQEVIEGYFPPPPYANLNTIFRNGKSFYSFDIYQPDKQSSTGWNTALAAARANVQATGTGADILSYRFRLAKADSASLLVRYRSVSGSVFLAEYMYKYTVNSNNQLVLNTTVNWPTTQPEGIRRNATSRAGQMKPLTDFFSAKTFEARWPNENPIVGSAEVYAGGLYNVNTASDFILGDLGTKLQNEF